MLKLYSCAVYIANLSGICGFELFCYLVNDTVFDGVAATSLDFGRCDVMRERFDDFRNGFVLMREIFNELCRNKRCVVKAVPFVSRDKNMSASFACKLCAGFVEFGFDI